MSNKNFTLFETPITVVVAGASKVGKSTWVARVIDQADFLFVHYPKRIVWAYGKNCYQPELVDKLKKRWKSSISFHEGFPGEKIESGTLFKKEDNGILVLDDLIMAVSNDQTFAKLFLQYSHHQNFSVIFLTQSLYNSESKMNPLILKNCDILVLFRNPRDTLSVSILGQRIFGKGKSNKLTESYEMACSRPFSYLICDFRPMTAPEHLLRTGCFKVSRKLLADYS